MIYKFTDKSKADARRTFGLAMVGDFAAPLGGRLFRVPAKMHTSAAKFVFKFAFKN